MALTWTITLFCKNIFLSKGKGVIYTWGHNKFGQLGLSPNKVPQMDTPHALPAEKFHGKSVVEVHSEWTHVICKCSEHKTFIL
jgi:alpha-tubulin suppressor-like RCC1 family protein